MPWALTVVGRHVSRLGAIDPARGRFVLHEADQMRQEARKTLAQIRTLARLEAWIRCAKAELASTPDDELLAEFIRVNERMLAEERMKLLAA